MRWGARMTAHPRFDSGFTMRETRCSGTSSTLQGFQMRAWILAAFVVAVSAAIAAGSVNAGSCSARASGHCVNTGSGIDLNSVPNITEQIVNEEPATRKQRRPSIEAPAAPPYTGPIVGVTVGKGIPTVGYSWSLE